MNKFEQRPGVPGVMGVGGSTVRSSTSRVMDKWHRDPPRTELLTNTPVKTLHSRNFVGGW